MQNLARYLLSTGGLTVHIHWMKILKKVIGPRPRNGGRGPSSERLNATAPGVGVIPVQRNGGSPCKGVAVDLDTYTLLHRIIRWSIAAPVSGSIADECRLPALTPLNSTRSGYVHTVVRCARDWCKRHTGSDGDCKSRDNCGQLFLHFFLSGDSISFYSVVLA